MSLELWPSWIDFISLLERKGIGLPGRYRKRLSEYSSNNGVATTDNLYWSERVRECVTSGGVASSDTREKIIGYRSNYLDEMFSHGNGERIVTPEMRLKIALASNQSARDAFNEKNRADLEVEMKHFESDLHPDVSQRVGNFDSIADSCGATAGVPTKKVLEVISRYGMSRPKSGYSVRGQGSAELFTWGIKSRFSDYVGWESVLFDSDNVTLLPSWEFFSPGFCCYRGRTHGENTYLAYVNLVFAKCFLDSDLSEQMMRSMC